MLLRHAKSDWSDARLHDIDRPLNARGQRAARLMAAYLREHRLHPDLILCSSAQRTRETLAPLNLAFRHEHRIDIRQDLYDGHLSGSYLPIIRSSGHSAGSLLVIGHNSATEQTALDLAGAGDPALKRDMQVRFPTAALAVFEFDIKRWDQVTPGSGHLSRFVKPRDLPDNGSGPE
ncbi:histidine phosphatase family protein [Roseibium sp. RKSG952]|nr:histidine phosphatase family protein [Roseibium sp. RKSG952]MTH97612.1 histidine phosphatase family protein [Roseibium sp. RKSG952]